MKFTEWLALQKQRFNKPQPQQFQNPQQLAPFEQEELAQQPKVPFEQALRQIQQQPRPPRRLGDWEKQVNERRRLEAMKQMRDRIPENPLTASQRVAGVGSKLQGINFFKVPPRRPPQRQSYTQTPIRQDRITLMDSERFKPGAPQLRWWY